ncbi:heavy metal-binding domain-containing protein [Acetilactobacillus jinshanensis]|uniref:UPF0145 protein ELX58_05430 n=1 Tax=Acetilactobacillus jinshanensis TaxID=1720083 RepID=A0A4P6ZL65_9LACO|nr:heavy metal-binding domain-containing protein [Acetilactobacillus jinshanensis]QBP18581.1 heavy metal-binding domain-containing protein [Acetilactobacillus jinshanensis]URL61457.1 heavy metal-binding domain-containing protein [uncultured bacterium]
MIISTTEHLPGHQYKVLGGVMGIVTMSPNVVSNLGASLKNLIGGEIGAYTKIVAKSRDRALNRMKSNAQKLGADAVVMMRFDSDSISRDMETVIAYGTAVKFTDK